MAAVQTVISDALPGYMSSRALWATRSAAAAAGDGRALEIQDEQCLESLGQIAVRYRKIKDACATLSRSPSRYSAALCATLNQILRDEYENLVVETEAKVLRRDASLVASGSFVPLSSIRATFAEWDAPLAALEKLVEDLQDKRYAQPGPLVDLLLTRSHTGIHRIASIYSRLCDAVQRVWIAQLQAFVVHGTVADKDPLASKDYTLLEGSVPSCLSAQSRESIALLSNPPLTAIIRMILETCERFVAQAERWGGDILPELLSEGSLAGGGDVGKMVKERKVIVAEVNETLHTLLGSFYEQLSLSTTQQPFSATADASKSVLYSVSTANTTGFHTFLRPKRGRRLEGDDEVRRHVERLLLRLDFNGGFSMPKTGGHAGSNDGEEILKQGGLT
ncbi:predicted protein [Postia placenta Mad-698-R]|nr:predicted protein [Postia placenta Mad-698-R]